MGKGKDEEEKPAPSGCCLVNLFHHHPRRSRFSLAASVNVPLAEPPKLTASPNPSGSTHGNNDKAKLVASPNSSVRSNKAAAASVSSESDKASLLVLAVSKPPSCPKNQAPQVKDRMTRKQSRTKRQNLVRASSSNVMLFANLGNLRGKKSAAMSPVRDVLDYLPKTAMELKEDAAKETNKAAKDVAVAAAEEVDDACEGLDAEGLKEKGNEEYKQGNYAEALALYDQAITKDPEKASYWSNKAAALIGLGRLLEAVWACGEAVRIDPSYSRAHYRLAILYTRLGDPDKAIDHYKLSETEASSEDLDRALALQMHIAKCEEAQTCKDWHALLKQTQSVVSSGADSSPQVFASQAEALLNLHRHEEADAAMTSAPKFDIDASTKFFSAADSAYFLSVQAQVDLAAGRFEDAVAAAQKASELDPNSSDISSLVTKAVAMSSARSKGNDLFTASMFEEACNAYGEGLVHDPYNAILLCNRAACLLKLEEWEKAVEDCSIALEIRPSYNKARLRRADCNSKLERWAGSIEDYEFLLHEMPGDEEVVKALFEAHVQLEKQQGGAKDSNHGTGSFLVTSKEQFREIVVFPGLCVALFSAKSSDASKNLVPSMEQLSQRFPSVKFFQVDVEESVDLAASENVNSEPVFKIYKNGSNVKDISGSDFEQLESIVISFST